MSQFNTPEVAKVIESLKLTYAYKRGNINLVALTDVLMKLGCHARTALKDSAFWQKLLAESAGDAILAKSLAKAERLAINLVY